MMNSLEIIRSKIVKVDDLKHSLAQWRFQGKKIVFTNGCFDIIHRGHVEYLAKTSDFGDILIIGLNTDHSVKQIKGPERPVQDEQTRALVLASFRFVTAVVLFNEDTPYNLIDCIQPDVLVKGADYRQEEIVGYDIVQAKGGKIETIDLVKGHSTTTIIDRLNT